MSFVAISIALGALFASVQDASDATPHAGMLRYPDISKTHIVFGYANDLWIVSRDGGRATPLASPDGAESFPKFDADGQNIAFMGNYEGNTDIYTIPVDGGVPTRLTHHSGAEILSDWSEAGPLLFHSNSWTPRNRFSEIYWITPEGGLPTKMLPPYGANGVLSADGNYLAYTPIDRDARTWKRYRGGMASDLWLIDRKTQKATQLTDWEGTDSQPLWVGNTLYFLSDAGPAHRLNIWKYDIKSKTRTQVSFLKEFDVKWPSAGPGPSGGGEIVFQYGAELRVLDLRSGDIRSVSIQIPGDQASVRSEVVDVTPFISSFELSSTGKRVAVEARGDIWTVPSEKGIARNLTRSPGVAERSPAWSPDGRWIAYFSDESGEYELWVTQSDGKGETKQLTKNGGAFRTNPVWSPDSQFIMFTENTGEMMLYSFETEELKMVDVHPMGSMGGGGSYSWSHDSRWITYSRMTDAFSSAVFIYNLESGEATQATSGMFADSSPTFDRKGDYLYYSSERAFSPTYSTIDTTFIYGDTGVLVAVPLRTDQEDPWKLNNDEEEWEEETEEEGEEEGEEGQESEEEVSEEEAGDDSESAEAPTEETPDDGFSGAWEGTLSAAELPTEVSFTMDLTLDESGAVKGSVTISMMGQTDTGTLEAQYNQASGELKGTISGDQGTSQFEAKVTNGSMSGTVTIPQGIELQLSASRSVGDGEDSSSSDEAREVVEVEFDGFEARGFQLPVSSGSFAGLMVNDKNQLIYARTSGGGASIKLFDINDDSKAEKEVASGISGYAMSADGKKLLVVRGTSGTVQAAAAGGGGKPVPVKGMMAKVDYRAEWHQIYTEAWRLTRQYFYDPNMHGIDWKAIGEQYRPMIDHCASREDVGFVLGELVAELNVGHSYVRPSPGFESGPRRSVGLLGVDFKVVDGAYQIARLYEGAAWDTDARNPLKRPGMEVDEGAFVLAVNGIPLDVQLDPWAAFQGLAGQPTLLTVADSADGENERDVMVTPIGDERQLRYRDWIEHNRAYVAEKSGGRVGYVYVPDTGIPGQNDLFRQFSGNSSRGALIVDERWNSGGQIPTRFVELLNRPVAGYFALRANRDLTWPPDGHQGPKCMLINGWSGSGGDAFPAFFKQAGLGKLIGKRTWGGLVGISGVPGLIDGGAITVPAFAYYETDGTWGIEGHGVDPDIEVLDDPNLMFDGGDPQLDAAIELMLQELESRPYQAPARPAYPRRSGMGIAEEDK